MTTPIKPTFENIYNAIIKSNPAELKKALEKWMPQNSASQLSNTVKYADDLIIPELTPITVAGQCALEGRHELVEILKKEYEAKLPSIILGYALGNHQDKVKAMLEKSVYFDKDNLVLSALEGYIAAGNQQAIKDLFQQHEAIIKKQLDFVLLRLLAVNKIIGALGLNNQYELFESVLQPYILPKPAEASELPGYNNNVCRYKMTILGLSLYCLSIRKNKAQALSRANELKTLFDTYSKINPEDEFALKYTYSLIIQCLTILDDKKTFQTYCELNKVTEPRIYEAFSNLAPELKLKIEKTKIYREYHIDAILTHYKEMRIAEKDNKGNTVAYHYHGLFRFLPNSFSFKQKEEACNMLTLILQGGKVTDEQGKPLNLLQHKAALRNGRLGDELRAFIKAGRADELLENLAKREGLNFIKSVRTVSEFVNALQSIIDAKAPKIESAPVPTLTNKL